MLTLFILLYITVNRAEQAARQYRAEAGAKVATTVKMGETKAKMQKLQSTLRTHQKKETSLQQLRHEANRTTAKLDKAFAEIRALEKANKALRKEAETCKKR